MPARAARKSLESEIAVNGGWHQLDRSQQYRAKWTYGSIGHLIEDAIAVIDQFTDKCRTVVPNTVTLFDQRRTNIADVPQQAHKFSRAELAPTGFNC